MSGASIPGPAAASWLAAAGWDVTVVERVDHLRDDGRGVDVDVAHGAPRRFDVVVIAEGARSRTRDLVLSQAAAALRKATDPLA